MPTYEYKCDECGHEWEQEQGIRESPILECPRCANMPTGKSLGKPRRQIPQRTGFVLNGRGWARDGYKG